jgi:hypothetical protein
MLKKPGSFEAALMVLATTGGILYLLYLGLVKGLALFRIF